MRRALIIAAAALSLAGCGLNPKAPISSDANQTITGSANASNSLTLSGSAPISPSAAPGKAPTGLVLDAQDAMWNLDQAIAIGVLPPADNADKCLHTVLGSYGLDPTVTIPPTSLTEPPKSFVPKNAGVLSLGAIAYIKAEELKAAGPLQIKVPESCGAVVFNLVTFGLQQTAASLLPGALGSKIPQVVLVPDK